MEKEPTIHIEEFVQNLISSVESLPTKELECCDLANEIGIVIAKIAGSEPSVKRDILAGIEHGFDLIRRRVNLSNADEDVELRKLLDAAANWKRYNSK